MVNQPRPLADVIAEHEAEGFRVIESTATVVTLERTNSWLSYAVGVVLGAIGGGWNPSPRHQHLYLHIKDGLAVARLAPPSP
jgi:hypothetical protein